MKNIVKVNRFNGQYARLYALPDGVSVGAGTIVKVEGANPYETAVGVTVSASYTVDGESETMVADLLHFLPPTLDNMKRVLSVYTEMPVDPLYNTAPDADPAPVMGNDEESEK